MWLAFPTCESSVITARGQKETFYVCVQRQTSTIVPTTYTTSPASFEQAQIEMLKGKGTQLEARVEDEVWSLR